MTSRVLYVIGAGMAGLSAAVAGVRAGFRVSVHEAAPHAGGRCRSFHDKELDCLIDNGTHLMLSGNTSVRSLTRLTGGDAHLCKAPAAFPFVDLTDNTRWILHPNDSALPWWMAFKNRRVPDSSLWDYMALLGLMRAPPGETVMGRLGTNPLFRRLIEPLSSAILNTEAEAASAHMLGAVMRETLGRGGAASRPLLAPRGLGAALVDPTLTWLRRNEVPLHLNDGLEGLDITQKRIKALKFRGAHIPLGADDSVILAVPPWVASRFLPSVVPPFTTRPIVNAHFLYAGNCPPMVGLVGGHAHWIFKRDNVLSVTVSAAGALAEMAGPDIAAVLWDDVRRALNLNTNALPPPCRVIKERRATLAHTPDQDRRRPASTTPLANLWLAGDWTATGLPCTIEGALRSGENAVHHAIASTLN